MLRSTAEPRRRWTCIAIGSGLLASLKSTGASERIPVEFWEPIGRAMQNIEAHVESTDDRELGNSGVMKELAESVRTVTVLTADKVHPETCRGFRTMYFDGAVERLAEVEERARTQPPMGLFVGSLEDAIEAVEKALRWFSELPSPQSKKYSAEQARTIVTLGKRTLADLQQRVAKRDAAPVRAQPATAPAPAPRACPKCDHSNDRDAKFCESCGLALASRVCSACGVTSSAEATFCKGCGKQVTS